MSPDSIVNAGGRRGSIVPELIDASVDSRMCVVGSVMFLLGSVQNAKYGAAIGSPSFANASDPSSTTTREVPESMVGVDLSAVGRARATCRSNPGV
jgi:hypothetical protein